jgi:hypothetical protein
VTPLHEVFNLWPSWSLILASTSIFCKEKILLVCTVISYVYYTDIYHNNEHLILTYCTVSEMDSTCCVNFYLNHCKLWDSNSYCHHISNPLVLEYSVQCTLQKRDLNGLNVILMTVAVVWLSQNYTAVTTALNVKCNKSNFLYCGILFRISGLQ